MSRLTAVRERLAIDDGSGVVALIAVTGALWIDVGAVGLVVAAAVAVARSVTVSPYPFAVGQFGVAALAADPRAAPVTQFALAALLATSLAAGRTPDARLRAGAAFALAAIALVGIVLRLADPLAAAAAIALVVGGACYLLYRYELVALDLVEGARG